MAARTLLWVILLALFVLRAFRVDWCLRFGRSKRPSRADAA